MSYRSSRAAVAKRSKAKYDLQNAPDSSEDVFIPDGASSSSISSSSSSSCPHCKFLPADLATAAEKSATARFGILTMTNPLKGCRTLNTARNLHNLPRDLSTPPISYLADLPPPPSPATTYKGPVHTHFYVKPSTSMINHHLCRNALYRTYFPDKNQQQRTASSSRPDWTFDQFAFHHSCLEAYLKSADDSIPLITYSYFLRHPDVTLCLYKSGAGVLPRGGGLCASGTPSSSSSSATTAAAASLLAANNLTRRFLVASDCLPRSYGVWVVWSVQALRVWYFSAFADLYSSNQSASFSEWSSLVSAAAGDGEARPESCCLCGTVVSPSTGVRWGSSRRSPPNCGHVFCESCLWVDIVKKDAATITCPECDEAHPDLWACDVPPPRAAPLPGSTPLERKAASLAKFQSLPVTLEDEESDDQRGAADKSKSTLFVYSVRSAANLLFNGTSQEKRTERLEGAVMRGDYHRVRVLLEEGCDLDAADEYGASVVHRLGAKLDLKMLDALIEGGADLSIRDFGGGTLLLRVRGVQRLVEKMEAAEDQKDAFRSVYEHLLRVGVSLTETDVALENEILAIFQRGLGSAPSPTLTYAAVSDPTLPKEHPAHGACFIDNAISEELVQYLLRVFDQLPVALQRERNTVVCSVRKYFSDWSSVLSLSLSNAIKRVGLGTAVVLQNVRFLNYDTAGGNLAPHTDLAKIESRTNKRSTHTILLYLTDFEASGETALMRDLNGPTQGPNILCEVAIRKARCLIFDHNCPHLGRVVEAPGKILIRTECYYSGA